MRTTGTFTHLRDGKVVLEVHALNDWGVVECYEFDIDAYALELAHDITRVFIEQRHTEGVI